MKKKYLTLSLLGLMGIVTGGVLSLQEKGYSQDVSPQVVAQCDGAGKACCFQYHAAIESAEQDWADNLQDLIDQQKPASAMVDEAYENLRTYNCWLEYICRSAQYSGYAPIESALGTGLTSQHIGQAPGCQEPEDLKLEKHYSSFVDKLKTEPLSGKGVINKPDFYQNNKINYLPACMTDKKNNAQPQLIQINNNFQGCKAAIEAKFGCSADLPQEEREKCLAGDEKSASSTSVTLMETSLKKAHADQEATALENKLGDIVARLHDMEVQVSAFSNFLTQLDQRLACVTRKCT